MKRFDQINMIPFIDIMLVLLAIVLTTASFISQGLIPVDLPKSEQSQQASSDNESLQVTISAKNKIFLNDKTVSLEMLAEQLKPYQVNAATMSVILRVDKAAAFEYFIGVVDVFKAKHFEKISIQAEQVP